MKPKRLRVIVEADGGARGNPGPAGYGAVVREAATHEVLVERAEAIGVATNNVAEYRVETVVPPEKLTAVLAALRRAHPYEEPAYDVYERVEA